MKGNWTYTELIDLEYCLSADRDSSPTALHERDREIYLQFADQDPDNSRDSLIRQWLLHRRQQLFDSSHSPGQIVGQSFRSLSLIIIAGTTIIGLVSGLGFFTYSGTTPVNVLNFLFIFVFSQLLMFVFLALAGGLRLAGLEVVPAPVVSLYGILTGWLLNRTRRLSAEQAGTFRLVEGMFRKQRSVYGQLFYWPFFRLSQQAMAGFNLGLLTATCFRIVTSDIAFGWQSTIQFSTEFMARVTTTLALPWSWLVPPSYAFPSVEQIEGSRIILKDGIYHLQTQDLVSWWPFLVLCVLFYGVIVRLVLLLLSRAGEWRARNNLKLNRPVLLQLVQRLTTPLVHSQAAAEAGNAVPPWPAGSAPRAAGPAPAAPLSALLLIPADISEGCAPAAVKGSLSSLGILVSAERVIQHDYDPDRRLLEELRDSSWEGDKGVVVIMESWMPPIQQTLSFIKELRAAAGAQVPIFVALIGPETADGRREQPDPTDRQVWHHKLNGQGDPYLSVLDLPIPEKNDP